MCIRGIRLITEKFPSFGALFMTVKIALKDIMKFMLAMTIVMIGFAYAIHFPAGPYVGTLKSMILTFIRLLYLTFGQSSPINIGQQDWLIAYANWFYVIFMIVFYFIMIKMLISIVIIRYLYLRSIVQLDNTVRGRIAAKESKSIRNRWINLLL